MEDIDALIQQLQAIAQSGKHYGKDIFDRERYEQLERVAKKLTSQLVDNADWKNLSLFFDADVGYVTPKVDVRAATFKDDKILLVKEKRGEVWSIPGGWADPGFPPAEIAVKETFEEAGIQVKPKRLIAVKDMQKNNYPKKNFAYIYKLLFECAPDGDELHGGVETSDAEYFTLDEALKLNLSLGRILPDDLKLAFECHHANNWETYFDKANAPYSPE
ncbi:NUDIX hydrolase [Companilactobacillus zhongbaensis]|uniref:NUDIX hydrolase n=1 Tax=Companilactobacillus zhongbaensis TaxID=2486009 RepID=UPI000F7B4FEB|nr:NUDIX hydrolase N-terminal domain-containing protein [Companilactobacillus zhongbaensis]